MSSVVSQVMSQVLSQEGSQAVGSTKPCTDFESADLITLFNQQFRLGEHTVLLGGASEPEFIPASPGVVSPASDAVADESLSKILFTHDYFASALHEVAHWCLAGAQRRKQHDYGYWYKPQRDASDQTAFEDVEARPQALEWIFSRAADFPFQPSVDNLSMAEYDRQRFARQIFMRLEEFCDHGLPQRAQQFFMALCGYYRTDAELLIHDFNVQSIQGEQ